MISEICQEKEVVDVYCDGACSNNPGIGGWGAVLIWKDSVKELYGYEAATTNNRMELLAAIRALKAIRRNNIKINIYTDSTYLKNGITEFMDNWKKTHWKNGKIKNIDLWKELDTAVCKKQIKWHWVRGHSGNKYNERADKLATGAIKEYKTKFINEVGL